MIPTANIEAEKAPKGSIAALEDDFSYATPRDN